MDWAVAAYTAGVALLAVVCRRAIPEWPFLVIAHSAVLAVLVALPPRGARWEQSRIGEASWRSAARRFARFLRYTYPALLLTPFFEEVQFTVNATSPSRPYWFEPYLYAADRAIFGTSPGMALSRVGSPILDELMHALYFSYYPLIISGIVIAWMGPKRGRPTPGAGFHTAMTSMMLGFFAVYVWYPFLPARGPWENQALMEGQREFRGFLFTPLVQWIIDKAAVSGGCFPSAHVSGTWGLIVGLAPTQGRHAAWFGLAAIGLGISCIYTRYHHAADVVAGVIVGVAGGMLGRLLTFSSAGAARRS